MRRLARLALLLPLCVTGCLYAHVRLPLDTDVDETRIGAKVGEASAKSVLWLFTWGDCGTAAAADQGGITTIQHLDSEYRVVLFGLYTRRTTIAYGE